ncbi:hypothetical protein SAY87_020293 [Trapa incisa]|uniref:Pentatricopeptide repeat-containing protein n=2 Tax=Trapa TaxID=22665 RepID=A0AAN7LVH9_TRANT|nr:hypothetical protein SAY87_020293 [Trapa incisa]KAK4793320.1 hypothetical protein SAY86_023755 [Trapa natans]
MSTVSRLNPVKSLANQIYKERNLKHLVEKFKESSAVDRFRTNIAVYERTVHRLAAAKQFQLIEDILEEQKKYRDISKEGFAVRIIRLYGRVGMFDNAQKLFDEMPDLNCPRTVMSFNAILAACVNAKKFDSLMKLFRELPIVLSVEPDSLSYNIVIKGFCKMGSLESAVSMLDEMEKKGILTDLSAFNTILYGFYGKGRLDDGQDIWKRMEKNGVIPNITSYSTKLLGLVSFKKLDEAAETVNEMRRKEIKPDIFCFNYLIKGYFDDGDLEGAKFWYGEIEKSEFGPNTTTFSLLIPFACDKGDLEFAMRLFEGVLVTSCRIDNAILQNVLDNLIKESKDDEAKKLVELAKSNKSRQYTLKLH